MAYVTPFVNPNATPVFPIIGLGYPALLLCNLLTMLVWALLRSKWVGLSGLTLLLGYSSCSRLINLSLADDYDGQKIKVATYNANFSKPITMHNNKAALEKSFDKYLKQNVDIDVLCVQEFGSATNLYLNKAYDFPHLHIIENRTVAIYSKYPFYDVGTIDFSSTIANTCMWADVLIGSDTVRVYTTHLESNRFDGKVPEVIEEDAPEEMSNSVLLGVVQHHQKFSVERLRQAQLIKRHQEKSPYKSIICGDFNETPQSYVFQVLADGMQDTFQEEGCGIASTFGERIPALRIDHMLVDPELEVLDHTISRSQFSDHYLIIADLGL